MRNTVTGIKFDVMAIAGTHVVLMAINPKPGATTDLRGFAFFYSKAGAPEQSFKGIKFFEKTAPNWKKGDEFSTFEQPVQSFFWSDYAASPDTEYNFKIIPRYGAPENLQNGEIINITIRTEKDNDGKHGVWFNRGIVASHKFAKDFNNTKLTDAMTDDVDAKGKLNNKEVAWLSRGLAEAMLSYINSAKAGEGLRVCAYEFTWKPIIASLKRAHERGVDVKIIYHADDRGDNLNAINAVGLPDAILTQRTRPPIPHNKYIVKLMAGKPVQVWTGSTNMTPTGLFGQTNVGHLVTDDTVAQTYLEYWKALSENPTVSNARSSTTALTPNPANVIAKNSTELFFSPRLADNMLDWYGARIKDADSFAMITLPFNVAPQILDGLAQSKKSLRLVIMENEPTAEIRQAEINNHGRLAFSNGAILGKTFVHIKSGFGGAKVAPIVQGELDKWFIEEELARPTNHGHVFFVHSKILLVDPLSDDPLICTGSANFSTNSLISNDENMLLIRGDTRVADIYLTELDRIFKHFYDRDAINRIAEHGGTAQGLFLDIGTKWIDANMKVGSYKNNRLLTFFPDMATQGSWANNAMHDPDLFADEAQRAIDKRTAANAKAKRRKLNPPAAKKSPAKKSPIKPAAKKQSPARKAPAKKSAVKKAASKKSATKKTVAKKNR